MGRELLLLRHGKSDWAAAGQRDFDRPLARRGRKAVKRIGAWVREHDVLPDLVLSSPAVRARETTRRFCRHAGLAETAVRWEESIYLASPEALLEVLATCPDAPARVLLVGHNPGFEELARHLAGAVVSMPTAALARLGMPGDWSALPAGSAELRSLTHPRELEAG